ncbi:MAG: dihydroorotate dehydrogenase electron transfer subunit [bacterium]
MYKQNIYKIRSNEPLTPSVFKMVLEGDTQYITAPGQFINIELEGKFLRRPISVCDWDSDTITIIYKIVGDGTLQMAQMSSGETLDIITGLGNGFDTTVRTRHPLLVGGGVGVPPMYALAKQLVAEGKRPTMIMGFNTAEEVFYYDEFCALGIDVFVTTVDGTGGTKGFVTDAMEQNGILYDYYYCCGPEPMLRALHSGAFTKGQLSFEERMGCGFGICMGCTCKTITGGYKRICKEGPVMLKEEINFND